MEEKKEITNIKKVSNLLNSENGELNELIQNIRKSKKGLNDTIKILSQKEDDIKKAKLEDAENANKVENTIQTEVTEAKVENAKGVKADIATTKVAENDAESVEKIKDESKQEDVTKVEAKTEEEPPKKNLSWLIKAKDIKEEPPVKKMTGVVKVYTPDDNRRPQRDNRNNNGDRRNVQQGDRSKERPQFTNGERRPQQNNRQQEISFIPKDNNRLNHSKKKQDNKSYEDKHIVNKKSQLKGQVNISDFDEDKSGYRKVRSKKKSDVVESRIKVDKAVMTKEIIPLKELSEKLGVSAVEITKILFKEGIIKTINDSIDYDTAGFVAAGLNIELELKLDKTAEDVLNEGFNEEADNEADYITRAPIVTVMGHVDHGKTSLLDYIRSSHVTDGEAGGITQHIGAYQVTVQGKQVTFLDTPGHAAFTAMRARGAQVTDIAVIVVAADDGIMPQTVEAISHAKAAGVQIIIAANKIDKPHANLDMVKQQLSERDVLVEDWGGDIAMVPVSAKTGEGVDKLLETILLVAEMKDLKANPKRKAKGTVIEAKLDKGKGPVANIIVQNGTLKMGDFIVAGTSTGKVRAMFDDLGKMVKEAGPSTAVSVLGLEEVPNAGDMIYAVDQEKLSKLVAAERKNKEREEMARQQEKVSLDDLFSKISEGTLKTLNIIIKADVQGSVEAVKQSLTELSTDEVKVNVIHSAVGAINETDVMLADSSNSIIIGFNCRPDAKAKTLAEQRKIDIKLYRIIYDAIEDIKQAMSGMLAPKFNDVYMGKAEVRDTFKITGVGMVAGCYVTDGKIMRSGKLRIYRDDVMICEGNVLQLKRFKDDVKEVAQGFECGISIENFNDIKVGDFIECYIVEEAK